MKEINKLEDIKHSFKYEDILYKEYVPSIKHPRMPIIERASQFSPFAALSGYGDEIKDSNRVLEDKIYLEEEYKNLLDEKLKINKKLKITYFIKDYRKTGGIYKEEIGIIKKIDEIEKQLIMTNKMKIPIKDIIKIDDYFED